MNGGIDCLQYSNLSNQFAATYFQGIFPGGSTNGKIVFVGFPFETIYPEEKRNFFLSKVISFFNSPVNISENLTSAPSSFKLYQNYPNPFNPSTKITYSIPARSNVSLKVFDLLGSEVAELVKGEIEAGTYDISFNASNHSVEYISTN